MSYCTLDATPRKFDGETLDPGARLNVYEATGSSSIIGKLRTSYFFRDADDWYPALRFQRLSVVALQLNDGPVAEVTIPDSPTATLGIVAGLPALVLTESTLPYRITEDGDYRITESGDYRIAN